MNKKLEEEFALKPVRTIKSYWTLTRWTKKNYLRYLKNEKNKSSRKSDVKKSSVQATNNSQQEKNE